MAIRLRKVNNTMIAICAARSVEKENDIYLDDEIHHALSNKFSSDYNSEGIFPRVEIDVQLREQEESNNKNREWWDKTYAY